MDRERFEQLVIKAIESLPDEFLELLDNVDVVVEDYPTAEHLEIEEVEDETLLLGLYEGIPRLCAAASTAWLYRTDNNFPESDRGDGIFR